MHCQPVWRQGEISLHCLAWFAWSLNVSQVLLRVVVSERNTHDVFLTQEPTEIQAQFHLAGICRCAHPALLGSLSFLAGRS